MGREPDARPWSGVVDRLGDELVVPWLDGEYAEAGTVGVPLKNAPELVVAVMEHLPQNNETLVRLMRAALARKVPLACMEEAVEAASKLALLYAEQAVEITRMTQDTKKRGGRRVYGTKTVEASGEYRDAL